MFHKCYILVQFIFINMINWSHFMLVFIYELVLVDNVNLVFYSSVFFSTGIDSGLSQGIGVILLSFRATLSLGVTLSSKAPSDPVLWMEILYYCKNSRTWYGENKVTSLLILLITLSSSLTLYIFNRLIFIFMLRMMKRYWKLIHKTLIELFVKSFL